MPRFFEFFFCYCRLLGKISHAFFQINLNRQDNGRVQNDPPPFNMDKEGVARFKSQFFPRRGRQCELSATSNLSDSVHEDDCIGMSDIPQFLTWGRASRRKVRLGELPGLLQKPRPRDRIEGGRGRAPSQIRVQEKEGRS